MADCNSLFDEIAGESRDLLNEIAISPDRAAAITAAAVLSDLLYLILLARMLKDDRIVAHTLGSETFSLTVRIDVCYGLGLISEKERRDLHLIRKIRNAFAHSRKAVSFEDPGVRDRCRTLTLANEFWNRPESKPADTKLWFLSGSWPIDCRFDSRTPHMLTV
jgi:DNA-binding MltR family transcriptional regulator